MISKKQRKASRFYNTVLRAQKKRHFNMRPTRKKISLRDHAKSPSLLRKAMVIPPIIGHQNTREIRTQRQSIFSFIPRSAKAIMGLFKRAS